MPRTLLIPGLDGSPAPHWQSWWAATDPGAVLVDLTDLHNPVPALWEIEVAGMILQHPDCVLVGHSLGAVLIARLLATWPHLRVRATLLVAPAEPHAGSRIARFAPLPSQPLPVPSILVASRNDPWMSFSRARHLAQAWDADLVDLGFAGHVNAASGFGPWPGGVGLRDALLERTAGVAFPAPAYDLSRAVL